MTLCLSSVSRSSPQVGRSLLPRCGLGWALLYAAQLGLMLAASAYFVRRVVRSNEAQAAAAEAASSDGAGALLAANKALGVFTLTWRRLPMVMGLTLVAGLLGGLLGLGGGLVMAPLLLSLGVHPQVRMLFCVDQWEALLKLQTLGRLRLVGSDLLPAGLATC